MVEADGLGWAGELAPATELSFVGGAECDRLRGRRTASRASGINRASSARLRARAGIDQACRRLEDLFGRRGLAYDRESRPDALWREPGAGGYSEMARLAGARRRARQDDRASSDRPAAKQQGAGGGRDFRRHRDRRPGKNRCDARPRNRPGRQATTPVRRGQYRRRGAEGGRPSRGRRRLYRALPPDLWIDDRGPDGHPPGERDGLAALRPAQRYRGTQRTDRTFYGHERRLAACGAARRDVCARRFRDFRRARFTSLKRESDPMPVLKDMSLTRLEFR